MTEHSLSLDSDLDEIVSSLVEIAFKQAIDALLARNFDVYHLKYGYISGIQQALLTTHPNAKSVEVSQTLLLKLAEQLKFCGS